MRFRHILNFVIVATFFWQVSTARLCITPDNVSGTCIPTEHCARITWMLTSWEQPYPAHVIDYVRQSHCGVDGKKHYACCAANDVKWHGTKTKFTSNTEPQTKYSYPTKNHISSLTLPQPANYGNNLWLPFGERVLNAMPCSPVRRYRIANGELASMFEFPWMALLEYAGIKSQRKRFQCSGSLITDRYVLTAAHCIVGEYNDCTAVRLGEYNLNTEQDCEHYMKSHGYNQFCAPPYENVRVERMIPHPQYTARPLNNDIGLLRLERSVLFQSHIKPICLPRTPTVYNNLPQYLIVAGWGITERGYASNVLLKTTVPLQRNDVCQQFFQRSFTMRAEHICAGGENRQSTCRGDSGGPMFAAVNYHDNRYVQFGVISSGEYNCGSSRNLPAVYTKVSSYMHWISSSLEP